MIYITIFFIITTVALLLTLIGIRAKGCLCRLYTIRNKLTLYADLEMTEKQGKYILNLENVKKVPELWEANENDITLISGDYKIPARFKRCKTVDARYRIIFDQPMDNMQQFWYVRGVRYDELFVSIDGGETKIKIHLIKGKFVEALTSRNLSELDEDVIKNEILDSIFNSDKYHYITHEFDNEDVISHIHEGKTTKTSLRYQALIKEDHEIFSEDYEHSYIKFYHVYDGYLYELPTKFIDRAKNLFEWEIYDLEPYSAYVGLSFSLDGGKTIYPSTSLFGITRDEDGEMPVLDEVNLAKPKPDAKKHKMWTKEVAIDSMGEKLTLKTYDAIVKKHYEDVHGGEFIPFHTVRQYHHEINWLETGKKLDE